MDHTAAVSQQPEEYERRVIDVFYLEPKDGDYDAVVEFFRREDVLGSALSQRGCLVSELHVPTNGSGPFLVTALWERSRSRLQGLDHEPRSHGHCGAIVEAPPERPRRSTRGEVVLTAGEPAPRLDG